MFLVILTFGDSRYPHLEESCRVDELLFPLTPGNGRKHLTGHVLSGPFGGVVMEKPELLVSQSPA